VTQPARDESVLVSADRGVATITLNRPAVHNCLNAEVLRALGIVTGELVADPDQRVIVITGAGERAFCAGADLDELQSTSPAEARALLTAGQRVLAAIAASPVPVIAAVNGYAFGGGFELAMACSFAVAATNAKFALPETKLGLIPGYGGTQRLPRIIGRQRALHFILTGATLDADEAYDHGLLGTRPLPPDELGSCVDEIARRIAGGSATANAAILEAVAAGADVPVATGLRLETQLAATAISGPDGQEGIDAFLAKRPPTFEARR
jgi:enoyl-CoA hydratase